MMFNSIVSTWEREFEVTFGIVSVLVTQMNVLENYLDIYLFKGSQKQKWENFLLPNMIELFETNRMSHFPPFYDDFFQ